MRRGDIVAVAAPGDFGKPRPAVIIQSDNFSQSDTVIVALLTSTLTDAPLLRVPVAPTTGNGLQFPSQIMADKVMTLRRSRIGQHIGHLDDETMVALNRTLALVLGFA
ncbi:type II toxin-antitoxin system PemK/MazF family toxin [Pelagibacterium sediminicola]|uniref:type II toxin-antitoxin system PemK/MazF family toxin n=1 Tax=Pelagibacterium sediminicola TaxID=2248761 RepID=UPI000E324233|nr:type II toxin-antitoxin system PemK/MazF family toxin [Pelagibacterium sediminicola]